MFSHGGHHLIAFLPTQQTGIHEHAGQLVADGAMQECGNDRRINAARQTQQHMVVAHLLAYSGDLVVDDVRGGPQCLTAADLGDEALEQGIALLGMCHFRVELNAVPALGFVRHRGDRNAIGGCRDGEPRRRLGDVIAVAHPHIERLVRRVIAEACEQAIRRNDIDTRVTELARIGSFRGAAQLRGQRLHAVANAEDGQARIEHFLRRLWRAMQRGGLWATGKDDALRTERGNLGGIVVPGPDFAVDPDLADTPRNQLGVLRAEVEDEDLVAMDVGHRGEVWVRDKLECA